MLDRVARLVVAGLRRHVRDGAAGPGRVRRSGAPGARQRRARRLLHALADSYRDATTAIPPSTCRPSSPARSAIIDAGDERIAGRPAAFGRCPRYLPAVRPGFGDAGADSRGRRALRRHARGLDADWPRRSMRPISRPRRISPVAPRWRSRTAVWCARRVSSSTPTSPATSSRPSTGRSPTAIPPSPACWAATRSARRSSAGAMAIFGGDVSWRGFVGSVARDRRVRQHEISLRRSDGGRSTCSSARPACSATAVSSPPSAASSTI